MFLLYFLYAFLTQNFFLYKIHILKKNIQAERDIA